MSSPITLALSTFLRDTLFTLLLTAIVATGVASVPYDKARLNNYAYKHHYMETHAEEIKVLLLGNSYFEYSVNPHLLGDSVFDLATAARYPHYDVELLRRYAPSMSNLRVCLFPLAALQGYPERFRLPCARDHYLYMGIDPPEEWGDMGNLNAYSRQFSFRNLRSRMECDSIGYQSEGTATTGKRVTIDTDSNYFAICTAYLTELARICHERHVRFVLVTPPHCNHLVDRSNGGKLTDGLEAVVAAVQSRYPAEYLNYIDQMQADSLYYDAMHLNHTGASEFARRLKDDLGL
ncbi:MAG: hypothetical protein J6I49_03035 [Bacteroidales bacterium]|nr:hypothetical protein [Bacteroidales bacterium]